MSLNKNYYVYVYLDPTRVAKYTYELESSENSFSFDYEPFYVGKGHGKRDVSHLRKSDRYNLHKQNRIQKIRKAGNEAIVLRLFENISEETALQLEREVIAKIGRRDLGTGTLTNMTDGGDGMSGYIPTEEQRRNNSILHKGRIVSEDTRKKLREAGLGNCNNVAYLRSEKGRNEASKMQSESVINFQGVIFKSVSETAKFYGLHRQTIGLILNGKSPNKFGLAFYTTIKRRVFTEIVHI